jgi:hypothetical protein
MRTITRRTVLSAAIMMPVAAMAQPQPAPHDHTGQVSSAPNRPPDAYLYIIWPNDGARIKGAFWVRFGLRNMGVSRAGDTTPGVGHHHLLVNVDSFDPNEPLPTDKNHLHFGGGQTEARLELPPGQYTLQLVLGDAEHRPFKPPLVSKKIRVTVTK